MRRCSLRRRAGPLHWERTSFAVTRSARPVAPSSFEAHAEPGSLLLRSQQRRLRRNADDRDESLLVVSSLFFERSYNRSTLAFFETDRIRDRHCFAGKNPEPTAFRFPRAPRKFFLGRRVS
jgi:hypothetical protein